MTLFLAAVAQPAELEEVSVERVDGLYSLRSVTRFDAEQDALFRVLTNFDLFKKFTSAIIESSNVAPDEQGRPQFFARMEGCVLLFCKVFDRNGYVETRSIDEIIAISDPERSDFKYSRERWELVPDGDGTIMIYEFDMEPAFWVPPVIGPYYIKKALKNSGSRAVNRIEVLAQDNASDLVDNEKNIVQSAGDQ